MCVTAHRHRSIRDIRHIQLSPIGNGVCTVGSKGSETMTKVAEIETAQKGRYRVLILTGPEMVGATDIYALVNTRSVREVILTHDESDSIIREYQDLCELMPPLAKCIVRGGDLKDAASAAIAIISGPAKAWENGEILVAAEAAKLKELGFGGVIIVTGHSADRLAAAVLNASNLHASRIIALGPQSGGAEQADGWPSSNVWCTASSAAVNAIDNCTPDCPYFEGMMDSSYRVFEKMDIDDSMRAWNVAVCVTQVCNAILTDNQATLPIYAAVSTGDEVSFSFTPCLIGRNGIIRVVSKDPEFNRLESELTSSISKTRSRDRKMPGLTPASSIGTS